MINQSNHPADSNRGEQNSRLRVAYMVSRFPSVSETFILNEMEWVQKQGVKVYVFSMMRPRPGPVHEQARKMMDVVHYSPYLSWRVLLANFYFLIRSPFKYLRGLYWAVQTTYTSPGFMAYVLSLFLRSIYFARVMQSLKIDHIHVHFAWTQHIAAIIISQLLGVSNSVTVHAFDLYETQFKHYRRDRKIVLKQLEAGDRIVTISQHNREFIANLCPNIEVDDVALIHLGLDLDKFRPNGHKPNNQTCQLLSVGSLIEKKGHRHLIEACAILAQRGLDFHCTIIGEGPQRPLLEELIADHSLEPYVTLKGALEMDQVLRLYQQSDIFALACVVTPTGDRDGMPTVLLEAMAMEIPVVSTPVTGIPEIVKDGENGFLVLERDVVALADALQTLMEDENLRIRMGRRARQRIVEEFQIQRNTAKLVHIFQELANQ